MHAVWTGSHSLHPRSLLLHFTFTAMLLRPTRTGVLSTLTRSPFSTGERKSQPSTARGWGVLLSCVLLPPTSLIGVKGFVDRDVLKVGFCS
ncbi:hypothetical protein DIPPA_03331 [Diplonema papillatum]|nr:hypothetical protein DIPPA_03331 [Diplonema papillatum]